MYSVLPGSDSTIDWDEVCPVVVDNAEEIPDKVEIKVEEGKTDEEDAIAAEGNDEEEKDTEETVSVEKNDEEETDLEETISVKDNAEEAIEKEETVSVKDKTEDGAINELVCVAEAEKELDKTVDVADAVEKELNDSVEETLEIAPEDTEKMEDDDAKEETLNEALEDSDEKTEDEDTNEDELEDETLEERLDEEAGGGVTGRPLYPQNESIVPAYCPIKFQYGTAQALHALRSVMWLS